MSWLRRKVLGTGEFPGDLRAQLQAEQPEVLEEGLSGSLTWRNYRAPDRYSSWRRTSVNGAVAVTATRVVVYRTGGVEIDCPFDHPRFAAITPSVDKPGRVCLAYDAHAFHADRSGTVEVRLRTPQAERIVERLRMRAITQG